MAIPLIASILGAILGGGGDEAAATDTVGKVSTSAIDTGNAAEGAGGDTGGIVSSVLNKDNPGSADVIPKHEVKADALSSTAEGLSNAPKQQLSISNLANAGGNPYIGEEPSKYDQVMGSIQKGVGTAKKAIGSVTSGSGGEKPDFSGPGTPYVNALTPMGIPFQEGTAYSEEIQKLKNIT